MTMRGYLMQGERQSSVGLLLAVAMFCGAASAQDLSLPCDWSYGQPHKMHWAQWPDYSSLGVDVGAITVADDFRCTATGPIRDVHVWGSFPADMNRPPDNRHLSIELSIYSDVPAQGNAPSRPGEQLWTRAFSPDHYSFRYTHDGFQGWYDPANETYVANEHRMGFQFDFCIADRPFVQEEGQVYWLAVTLKPLVKIQFVPGLKTTLSRFQWNDCSVRWDGTQWVPMTYPKGHKDEGRRLDLAFVIGGGDDVRSQYDLGDAPDSSNSLPGQEMTAYPGVQAHFPTVYGQGAAPCGPLHRGPTDCAFLGQRVSLEQEADLGFDEDPTNNLDVPADRPDLDSGDDGVVLPLVLPQCGKVAFDYTVTVTDLVMRSVYVNVWFDWNRDGDWDDVATCADGTQVPEWAVRNQQVQLTGIGTFAQTTPGFRCWHPTPDQPGPLWMRITLSEKAWQQPTIALLGVGGAGPSEGYEYGETEDYRLYPKKVAGRLEYDWGDAPDDAVSPGYPTLAVHQGANHVIAGPWFGDANDRPDAESDGEPNALAAGDDDRGTDDEGGVCIPPLVCGQMADVTLEVNGGGGIVQGWIDFDCDQQWQASEKVFDGFLPDGVHNLAVNVPKDAVTGWTFARFRISRNGGLDPAGPAGDGEVEDHRVWIWQLPRQTKWVQLPDTTPNGIDVCIDSNDGTPRHVADDFQCTSNGRITQIILWGSWKDDKVGRIRGVHVEIHPDVPAELLSSDPNGRYSKPGPEVLWSKDFGPNQFSTRLYHQVYPPGEWWRDFGISNLKSQLSEKAGADARIWQVDIPVDASQAFLQTGTESHPVIYWLHVQVDAEGGRFGWKTRRWPDHFMDDAVWDTGGASLRSWEELRYERPHPYYGLDRDSIDMAFLLVSTASGEVPTCQPTCITTCPPVDTTCPAVSTQCPTVQTQCPAVETHCPASDTQCPATATRCPMVNTQCPAGPTYCPAVSTECPPVDTQCPSADTKCPASDTKCPPADTKCPLMSTRCPTIDTQCPSADTKCPASDTKCPPADTKCPLMSTRCPTVDTQCPSADTKCPASDTQCPAADTKCPLVSTQCPAYGTRCPAVDTQCPTSDTKCPATDTRCPAVSTQCPTVDTKCPPAGTKCPLVDTQCPTYDTRCPATQTQCQYVQTQCPVVQTQCPATQTQCQYVQTQCPPVLTQCPPTQTKCQQVQTQCPAVLTQCPPTQTQCQQVQTQCPVVITQCPPSCALGSSTPVPAYLAVARQCPVVEAQCPLLVARR